MLDSFRRWQSCSCSLSILEDCGYGSYRIRHGPCIPSFRTFRKELYPASYLLRLWNPWNHGFLKTIEADNDRRLTIMTATFIPCGAKLPVIALMGGIMTAYATGDYVAAGFITPLMYFIGVVAVLVAAIILKKTKPFSGKPAPFVMELPQYHIPSVKTVLLHVWERLKGFIIKAGTILFLATVIMWILSSIGNTGSGIDLLRTATTVSWLSLAVSLLRSLLLLDLANGSRLQPPSPDSPQKSPS